MSKDTLILGIESSCDETAASVVKNGRIILSNVINSQIKIHEEYGGVVPEIASRCHTEVINQVVKEALKEVLAPLDGEVECKVINDKVYVNKIPEPESSFNLELFEGINVSHDSVTITDYNPDTINKLIVHWNNGEDIVYTNDELIDRFGEKVSELDAVKTIIVTETDDSSSETDSSDTNTTNDDSDNESNTSNNDTSTKEVPVETYEEALNFAKTEWAKIRRDNGHTIECRVNASPEWRQGEWVKVYFPSFNEEGFMYITKVSQSISPSNNQCNLTLSDYPPSLGEPKENSEYDSEEEEEETTEEETE